MGEKNVDNANAKNEMDADDDDDEAEDDGGVTLLDDVVLIETL